MAENSYQTHGGDRTLNHSFAKKDALPIELRAHLWWLELLLAGFLLLGLWKRRLGNGEDGTGGSLEQLKWCFSRGQTRRNTTFRLGGLQ